jgi:hypothetical protein
METPGLPLASRRARRAAALLESAWARGWLPRPSLAEVGQRSAALAAGHAGPPDWQQALVRLIDSLEHEARLNAIGLTFASVQLTGLLRQRERAQALWRAHPEIAGIELPRPVIVLGHMRSGTTRLQRLLGCDPRFNQTRFFEVMEPLAPRMAGRIDWRVARSWAQLKALDWLNPELQAIHPTSARAVEEVFGLLSLSFYGAQLEAQWHVPAFARWWEGQDRTWVYREFRQWLQTLAWQRRDPARPFVLKAPQFMEDLGPLLAVFPDARLVCLERDPLQVVGSSASLVWNQMKLQTDALDPHWVGAEWLRKTVRRERIAHEVRAAHPGVPAIAIDFPAMNHDWRGEMRRLYPFLGLELSAPVERAMAAYLQRAERSGFRGHRYRLEDFGLTAGQVRAALQG